MLTLFDNGADAILWAYLTGSRPSSGSYLYLRLFTNNLTVNHANDNLVFGTFTEATGGGYAAATLAPVTWNITSTDPSEATYTQQTFTFTGPLIGTATVYGYHISDGTGIAVWAEPLVSPFVPITNGDNIKITPLVQLSKGTPA